MRDTGAKAREHKRTIDALASALAQSELGFDEIRKEMKYPHDHNPEGEFDILATRQDGQRRVAHVFQVKYSSGMHNRDSALRQLMRDYRYLSRSFDDVVLHYVIGHAESYVIHDVPM